MSPTNSLSPQAKADRLNVMLTRVRAGQSIEEVIKLMDCHHWYYRQLTKADRAPIVRAVMEGQQYQQQLTELRQGGRSSVTIELATHQMKRLQLQCRAAGVSVSERIGSLIDQGAGLPG